jgi:uncharacterized membrane protein YczE
MDAMTRRLIQLLLGLPLYGTGCAVMVAAGIGLDPWTVFAQGLSEVTGIGIGWMTNLIGLAVLALWIPLRQRPGAGTVLNILLVGTAMQLALSVLPRPSGFVPAAFMFAAGIVIVGFASGLYIGAHFGPGPRDGLMTGISARFGWPIWLSRTSVELSVLLVGWMLGGTIGIGTVAFALTIGPLAHAFLRVFDTRRIARAERPRAAEIPQPADSQCSRNVGQSLPARMWE